MLSLPLVLVRIVLSFVLHKRMCVYHVSCEKVAPQPPPSPSWSTSPNKLTITYIAPCQMLLKILSYKIDGTTILYGALNVV